MVRFDDLGVQFDVANDKIRADIFGPPAAFFADQVDKVVKAVNNLKVIARRDGALVYNLYNPPQPTRAGLHAIVRNIKAKAAGHALPATANLAITTACQARCVHCSADPLKDAARAELTTEELKSVVGQAVDLGATLVIFTGGDPLLRRDLFQLISHVDRGRAVPMIFTNGDLLTTDNVNRLADSGLYSMNISIDSPDPSEHDALRGVPGLFNKAIEGGWRALDAGVLVGLSTHATSERLRSGKLEALLNFARREGFNEVTIFDRIPSGKLLKDTEMILTDDERRRIVELATRFNSGPHPMGVIAQSIVNSPLGAGCYGAASELYMTPYGDVAPCDFNPVSFGNVRQTPLAAIWRKMATHPDFACQHKTCRMQTASYRERFIDFLPEGIKFPVPIEVIERLREQAGVHVMAAGD